LNRMYFLVLFTLGCDKMDRGAFIGDYADAYCDWEEGCGKIANYGTFSACVEERENDARYTLAPGDDGCSFDEGKAQSCVDAFSDLECKPEAAAEIEACLEVSDCYEAEPEDNNDPT
jgi:hypothetical protein